MNIQIAVDILHDLISVAVMLITPLMVTAITVGVSVSLLQSITSIQEQTLTFVPKLLAVSGVLVVSANWMLRTLMEFGTRYMERIASLGAS